jgi:hypothetical protein
MIKLSEKWSNQLIEQPESGMGYQVVDVTLKDGKILRNLIVLWSEYLQFEPSGYFMLDDSEIENIEVIRFQSLRNLS